MINNKIRWLGKPEERIISIRKFRQYIDTISLEEAVPLIQKNWNNSPTINAVQFDILNMDSYPTPWQLFAQAVYCKNAQALGAYYCLQLSKHSQNHIFDLTIIDDVIEGISNAIVIDKFSMEDYKVITTITVEQLKNKLGDK